MDKKYVCDWKSLVWSLELKYIWGVEIYGKKELTNNIGR
jgi:hypothetical protein